MAKYSGFAGIVKDATEVIPGIWEPAGVTEIKVTGDLLSSRKEYSTKEDSTNDDVLMDNQISIVMSSDVVSNLGKLRYLVVYGTRYKIQSFQIARPRLVITLGGLWNGDVPTEKA